MLLTFKAIYGHATQYVCALTKQKTSVYSLRSNQTINLVVPNTKRKTMGDRAFAIAGPKMWNALPQDIKLCSGFETFKSKLKAYLFDSFLGQC